MYIHNYQIIILMLYNILIFIKIEFRHINKLYNTLKITIPKNEPVF